MVFFDDAQINQPLIGSDRCVTEQAGNKKDKCGGNNGIFELEHLFPKVIFIT